MQFNLLQKHKYVYVQTYMYVYICVKESIFQISL